jgi:hypothetical protein
MSAGKNSVSVHESVDFCVAIDWFVSPPGSRNINNDDNNNTRTKIPLTAFWLCAYTADIML